jgi:hypothetical protein
VEPTRRDIVTAGIEDGDRLDLHRGEALPCEEADDALRRHPWSQSGIEAPAPGAAALVLRDGQQLFCGLAVEQDRLAPDRSRPLSAVLVRPPVGAGDRRAEEDRCVAAGDAVPVRLDVNLHAVRRRPDEGR